MAAKSLGLIRDPAALDPLRKCLFDENPYVKKMAAISLLQQLNEKKSSNWSG
jgi:HEAT repeat protein